MHEISHNLNLKHSSDSLDVYGDQSCLMGYSYSDDDDPAMCFNGHKSWELGWYNKGHVLIDGRSKSFFRGKLIGVNNYKPGKLRKKKIIIKIYVVGDDYYVMFNLATGINSGVIEGRNKVMITSTDNTQSAPSYAKAELSSGQRYYVPGTKYFVKVLKIKLNTKPPFAKVIVKKTK